MCYVFYAMISLGYKTGLLDGKKSKDLRKRIFFLKKEKKRGRKLDF